MALRIRFQYPTASTLGYSIERLPDGLLYDFATSTFVAAPTTPISALPEDGGNFLGRYKMTLTPTPASTFTDGYYTITVHDMKASNMVVAELSTKMHDGDNAIELVEPGEGLLNTMRLLRAVLAGKATDQGGLATFLRKDGTTPALTVAHDGQGNRGSSTVGTI